MMISKPAPMEVPKASVALHHIKPDAPLKFAEIHRAEVQRPGVRLGEVVRPVHQAVKPDAVLDPEHMTRLVRQDFQTAPEHRHARVRAGSLAIEARIVTGKAVNAHTVPSRRLAEDEVSTRVRIAIRHRYAQ
jgi:hypothetical protein